MIKYNVIVGIQSDWRPLLRFDSWNEFLKGLNPAYIKHLFIRAPFGLTLEADQWIHFDQSLRPRNTKYDVREAVWWCHQNEIECTFYVGSPQLFSKGSRHRLIPEIIRTYAETGIKSLAFDSTNLMDVDALTAIKTCKEYGIKVMVEGIPRDQEGGEWDLPIILRGQRMFRWRLRSDAQPQLGLGRERPWADVSNQRYAIIREADVPKINAFYREAVFNSVQGCIDACHALHIEPIVYSTWFQEQMKEMD